MITHLNEVDPGIVDDKKIDVTNNSIRNPRIHRCLESMQHLGLFLLECDSNNTSVIVKPSDAATIRALWDAVRSDLEFNTREENNDLPTGNYELEYLVFTTYQREIQAITNPKIKRIAAEVYTCMQVCLGTDSAKSQGFTEPKDAETMMKSVDFVDRVMDEWIGKGTNMTDTGKVLPALTILGTIMPSVDSDWARKAEPSKGQPSPQHPDAGSNS